MESIFSFQTLSTTGLSSTASCPGGPSVQVKGQMFLPDTSPMSRSHGVHLSSQKRSLRGTLCLRCGSTLLFARVSHGI